MSATRSSPTGASPPGEVIVEETTYRGLPLFEMPVRLLTGAEPLTEDIAEKLHAQFGISTQFWLNLEAAYRKPIA